MLAPMLAPWLALSLAAPPGCGLPPLSEARPFTTGETLVMELGLLGAMRVGEIQFSVERPLSAGAVIPLAGRARNTARFGSLQRLVAVGLSWVDARTLRPERYREESDEDGRRRLTDVRFLPAGPEVALEQSDQGRPGRSTFRREGEALDPVSAMYLLRAARLAPGGRFCFDMVGNGRAWRVEGSVAAKPETFEVPAGRFAALRLDASARPADGRGASRPLHLWLSNDARRLPLAAVSEVELGPVTAKLVEVRGGKR